jgi:hypothetical protein
MAAATSRGRNRRLPKTFLILVLAVGMVLFVKEYFQAHRGRSKQKASRRARFPFTVKPALFSTAERELWGELNQAVGRQHTVFGKVRLADVVTIRPGLKESAASSAIDEISAISLDFVICRHSNLAVVAGVKLTDAADSSKAAADEIACAEGALSAAGVPLVRLAAGKSYPAAKLVAELQRAKNALAAAKRTPPTDARDLPSPPEPAPSTAVAAEPCPTCGARLVKRRISGGRMNGNYVLACANYPSCRHIYPLTAQTATTG